MSELVAEKAVFGGRFELVEELGRGSQGITYLARELGTDRRVAVKKLAVSDSPDWKSIELFEREGQVLKSLNHPGVPRYIDAFHEVEAGSQRERFVLVQEYVDGENLEELIDDGLRMDESGTRDFLEQMLEILAYLHALEPPVIHRDIKPSNIMRDEAGRWVLIDFGGVQVISGDGSGGASTVVGTSGYMPFEQLVGRAVTTSDLYALGATVVHLLSHRHPSDLPVDERDHMRLLFGDFVTTSATIMELLEGMLEPLWEDRMGSAAFMLGVLKGNIWKDRTDNGLSSIYEQDILEGASWPKPQHKRLAGRNKKLKFDALTLQESKVMTERSGERLRFEIRRRGSAARAWEIEEYTIAKVALLGIGFAAMRAFYWYVEPTIRIALGFGALCSLLSAMIYSWWMRMKRHLEISAAEVLISRGLFGVLKRRIALDRVYGVRVVPKRGVRDKEIGYVIEFELDGGEKIVRYGTGQQYLQSEWMAEEIRKAIDGYRGLGEW